MKLMVILGTRPEAIKLAPVVLEALRRTDQIELIVCSTGQHREMLDQTLDVFGICPDLDLSVMQNDQSLASLTARLIEKLDAAIRLHKPDIVLVQGDTTTAFVAGLVAFYLHIPVGHVEAGLRTGDISSPFPEELNRILLTRMAYWHFAPTATAMENLILEGVPEQKIYLTGNTVVDAIEHVRQRWTQLGISKTDQLAPDYFPGKELVLVTAHRRENQGEGLQHICDAIYTLCFQHPTLGFIFPLHFSPQVRNIVFSKLKSNIPNLLLIDPVNYETNLYLQSRSRLVITDSGGIQEEAPSFGVPTVVMREYTERMEGVTTGFSTLAGTGTETIVEAANTWLADTNAKERLSSKANPYGDGLAAARILDILQGKSVRGILI
jgi:UDP-N-acetylglucosamine 2-epimerase (non-hydrolysing)